MSYFLLITILIVLILLFMYLNLRKKFRKLNEVNEGLMFELRSTRVKHGKNWEHFIPFMEDFPGDKENAVFLGMPIDYISFDDETIKFIEVKTGKSTLNKKQRQIKDLVKNKKIEWYELKY